MPESNLTLQALAELLGTGQLPVKTTASGITTLAYNESGGSPGGLRIGSMRLVFGSVNFTLPSVGQKNVIIAYGETLSAVRAFNVTLQHGQSATYVASIGSYGLTAATVVVRLAENSSGAAQQGVLRWAVFGEVS